jgi:GNAT superfamily N-acetyltransferase
MSGSTDSVRIRIAHPKERDKLEALQWRASLANEENRPHLEANPNAIELPAEQVESGQVIVAEIGGSIAGFAAVVGGELDGLFVEPDLWRKGIGKALVDAATLLARRRGLSLSVVANSAAREFYEKCGLTVEGEAQTRFGPALRMSR